MSPRPIRLPHDALPHDTTIEWWYFNGHLMDRAKPAKRYAFMDCLFRANAKKAKIPFLKNPFARNPHLYFAHSIVSDIGAKKSRKEVQGISFVSGDSFSRPLLYANYSDPVAGIAAGYVNHEIAETVPGTFHIKTSSLDLTLVARKKPLLEGGKGYITVGGKSSYYYSLTDLAAKGTMNIGGAGKKAKWIEVEGKAWMDHQWANVPYGKNKWTWFSLQLEDGTDIMCVEYGDGRKKDRLVDVMHANGRTEHYKDLILLPGKDVWKSKATKASYPLSWRIGIPRMGAAFAVKAPVADQEMVSGSINYWEGPLEVTGMVRGKRVKGKGFMELVGYPADYNALLFTGREIYKNIRKMGVEK